MDTKITRHVIDKLIRQSNVLPIEHANGTLEEELAELERLAEIGKALEFVFKSFDTTIMCGEPHYTFDQPQNGFTISNVDDLLCGYRELNK